jgi:anti-anti-sigma factor
MDIKSKAVNEDSVIIKIIGRLNIEEVQSFEKEFDRFLSSKKFIALDLSGLKYIDSSGIGSLIKAMNMTKNSGVELLLFDITPTILNVFKLAYLDKFFTILSGKELSKRHPQFKL